MNCAEFNQDASCIAVGTDRGFRLFGCAPFGRFYGVDDGGVGGVAMLFSTSLVAVVGRGEDANRSPRRLRIVNTKRERVLCELTFPTSVLAVKMSRKRLAVVLESQIYVYNISNMKLLHTIETPPNREGVADLSSASADGSAPNFLVYPAGPPAKHHSFVPTAAASGLGVPSGDLCIFDCDALAPINVVRAHRSPLALAIFNSDGSLVATCSDRGTLVRVFSIPSGTLLYQFRRGSTPARIWSLAFNLSSTLLAVASSTGTVHIYKLLPSGPVDAGDPMDSAEREDALEESPESAPTLPAEETAKKKGWGLRRKVRNALPKTPTSLQDMWERSRDFAWFRLPVKNGTRSVVAFVPLSNVIYAATATGRFFQCQIDIERGGECERVAEYSLLG